MCNRITVAKAIVIAKLTLGIALLTIGMGVNATWAAPDQPTVRVAQGGQAWCDDCYSKANACYLQAADDYQKSQCDAKWQACKDECE
jgi:hypothetical protein